MNNMFTRLKVAAAMIGFTALSAVAAAPAHAQWILGETVGLSPTVVTGPVTGANSSGGFAYSFTPGVSSNSQHISFIGAISLNGAAGGGTSSSTYKISYNLQYSVFWGGPTQYGTYPPFSITYIKGRVDTSSASSQGGSNGTKASVFAGHVDGATSAPDSDYDMRMWSTVPAANTSTLTVSKYVNSWTHHDDEHPDEELANGVQVDASTYTKITTNFLNDCHDYNIATKAIMETQTVTAAALNHTWNHRTGTTWPTNVHLSMQEGTRLIASGDGQGTGSVTSYESIELQ